MQWNTQTIEDFEQAAREIVTVISDKHTTSDQQKACVVCLHGDLGAGKTTMTQFFGKLLGVSEIITSPTFVIKKSYITSHNLFNQLVHIDAYRLENEKNLDVFQFNQDITTPNTLIVIEWPELITSIIPRDAFQIIINHTGTGREVLLK